MLIDIITAAGTVVAACSVIATFVLYKLQKTDEYLAEVRKALQNLHNSISELNAMVDFELAYELCSELISDPLIKPCIHKLYAVCNEVIMTGENEESAKEKIEDCLGVFGTSFQNPLALRYNTIISNITQQAVVFYPSYKGLFRFSKACALYMKRVFVVCKRVLMNEELLTKAIYETVASSDTQWSTYEDFQKALQDCLVAIVSHIQKDFSQKNIDCICELVEMVYSSHIALSRREWMRLKRRTRNIELVPASKVDTITGDLREAEKQFREIMDRDQGNHYISLVQKIEGTNT